MHSPACRPPALGADALPRVTRITLRRCRRLRYAPLLFVALLVGCQTQPTVPHPAAEALAPETTSAAVRPERSPVDAPVAETQPPSTDTRASEQDQMADRFFSELVGEPLTDPVRAIALADEALSQGKPDLAKVLYLKAIDLQPGNDAALSRLENIYRRENDRSRLLDVYRLMVAANPADARANEQLGLDALNGRRFDEARRYLTAAVGAQPERWVAHNGLGIINDLEGRYEEAITHYQAALVSRPNDADVLNNLGYSHYMAGQDAEAEARYRQVLRLKADHARATNNLAVLLARRRDYPAAVEMFATVMPRAQALNNVGVLAMLEEDFSAAKTYFEQALSASPTFFDEADANLARLKAIQRSAKALETSTGTASDEVPARATTAPTEPPETLP